MPHFILEYSSNLDKDLDVSSLFEKLHKTTIDLSEFPTSGIRSRARRCEEYRIAEGNPENAFVHLTMKIGAGRSITVKKTVADRIFDTLTAFLQQIYDNRSLSIGFELIELHPELTYKKNNIESVISG